MEPKTAELGECGTTINTKAQQQLTEAAATPGPTGKAAPLAVMESTATTVASKVPDTVVINVGGQRYESLHQNFVKNFPNSRLWKLARAIEKSSTWLMPPAGQQPPQQQSPCDEATMDEILQLCDRFKRGRGGGEDGLDSDYTPPEFFFDRNWTGFAAILDAYRTGHLHLNSSICAVMTREDMAYWGMDELSVEPCCAVKFYPEIEICIKEIDMEESENLRELERQRIEDFGQSFMGRSRKFLWNLFEYPSTSQAAKVPNLQIYFEFILGKPCICFFNNNVRPKKVA